MRMAVELLALILSAVAVALALAHALELSGKLRLAREEYLTVQRIYYPGFTYAGACEPLAVLALAALLALTPAKNPGFWLIAAALAAAALTQLLYWTVTAPVNRVWLTDEKLTGGMRHFFGAARPPAEDGSWIALRNRWEGSHLCRTVTAAIAFLLLAIAILR